MSFLAAGGEAAPGLLQAGQHVLALLRRLDEVQGSVKTTLQDLAAHQAAVAQADALLQRARVAARVKRARRALGGALL